MINLQTKLGNITFNNPFILASSPVTRNAEMISRAFNAGWAGAVTKTICLNPESIINVNPRLYGYKSKSGLLGLNNIELISDRPVNAWLREINLLKEHYPDRILIASIMAEAYNLSGWKELALLVQDAGADIIELNLSCPHGMPERGMGSFCSEVPQISADITSSVKSDVKIPVWAKLSPNVSDISYLAQLCLESGADGIVAINTVKGFSGINIETLEPNLNIDDKSAYGGFSGKIIKPLALKAVSDIAVNNQCYISASGGISSWQDTVEFLLLGASTVQICTEVMFNGYGIINNLLSGLNDYLCRHNYDSVQSLTGLSLDKISKFEDLNKNSKLVAEISKDKCIKCGKCFVSCRDGGYQAIELRQDNVFIIGQNKCTGCGLCKIVCPTGSIVYKTLSCKISN